MTQANEENIQFEIPQIPVKVKKQKKGNILIVELLGTEIKLKAIGRDTYDLVTLEQFITQYAKLAYDRYIQELQKKQQFKDSFLNAASEVQEAELVSKLLESDLK